MSDDEITDPKLLKYLKKSKTLKGVIDPDITKVKDLYQKPDQSISMVWDGVPEKPQKELILTRYKCNKCGGTFNHTPRQAAAGILPSCPNCDR